MEKKRMVVLTGAGVSEESGLNTFRDSGGVWEKYSVEEVASIQAWQQNPQLVLDFYNKRRSDAEKAQPNGAHKAIADLEDKYDVAVITQNVDDLHERAGSTYVLHLHGELTKMRSESDEHLLYAYNKDIKLGDKAKDGGQLRPHIVWFGEAVPKMTDALGLIGCADIVIIVGTSLSVYPAASLLDFVSDGTPIYVVDPNTPNTSHLQNVIPIRKKAVEGMKELMNLLEK